MLNPKLGAFQSQLILRNPSSFSLLSSSSLVWLFLLFSCLLCFLVVSSLLGVFILFCLLLLLVIETQHVGYCLEADEVSEDVMVGG
jgi:hypothetical protein